MSKADDRVLSQLGLCKRAGRLVTGEEAVMEAIRSGQAKLVIMSDDASEGTAKKVRDKCTHYQVKLIQKFSRYMLGWALGQEARVTVAINDDGFSQLIQKSLDNSTEVTGD